HDFTHDSRLALANTGDALKATANPIEPVYASTRGRTWVLSANVQAYALALTISFLALLLAAGSLAAERDENVIGRLARGLVGLGQLVWAKVALAAAVALTLGLAIALVFGIAIEAGNVVGRGPGERLSRSCSCCRSSSSASSRRRSSRPRAGSATRSRSCTPSVSSRRRSTTRARGVRSAASSPGWRGSARSMERWRGSQRAGWPPSP